MSRFLVTARLKPGAAAEASSILREGPPFDLEASRFERHYVFLAGDEIIFLFEGEHAAGDARRLLADAGVMKQASRLAALVEGPPQRPVEVFAWERAGGPHAA
jgi:hypothetical protein